MKDASSYKTLSSYTTNKNIDRVRFINSTSNNSRSLIAAGYHLDKESQTKSGALYKFDLINNETLSIKEEYLLPYGVLDFKFSSTNNFLYTSNSDNSLSTFYYEPEGSLQLIKQTKISSSDSSTTCNTLDISWGDSILLASNDGLHHIYDCKTEKFLTSTQGHEYGLWSCLVLDDNLYLTGSEDSMMKMWDRRLEGAVAVNKSHQASVNCIHKDWIKSDTQIVTGSYDESLSVFDIRNIRQPLMRNKLGHSLWDIKQEMYKDNRLLLIPSIYEGFNIISLNQKLELEKTLSIEVSQTNFHNSIVYGVDSFVSDKNELIIASCSFYDNLILTWKV